ncbi:MAG TPA: hypothetical protein VMQ58_01765 [Candidatus Saccharimonadales bacterium]|jgi:hypothetical protein|nr:hypothetical protein [Candidatus Saccharimonadales bacterium]
MKRDDITLIVSTMVISAIFAIVLTSKLISSSTNQEVLTVNTINTSFQPPSTQYLNENSIDPTLLVKIGGNTNNAPFTQ